MCSREAEVRNDGFSLLDEGAVDCEGTCCIGFRQLEVMFCFVSRVQNSSGAEGQLTKNVDGALVHNVEEHQ
jgi:hypothetical protein